PPLRDLVPGGVLRSGLYRTGRSERCLPLRRIRVGPAFETSFQRRDPAARPGAPTFAMRNPALRILLARGCGARCAYVAGMACSGRPRRHRWRMVFVKLLLLGFSCLLLLCCLVVPGFLYWYFVLFSFPWF